MNFKIQQTSSLEKVRAGYTYDTLTACAALAGERVSWQVAVEAAPAPATAAAPAVPAAVAAPVLDRL